MTSEIQSLLRDFENRLFASAADEHNDHASDKAVQRRYEAAQLARSNLIRAIEALEERARLNTLDTPPPS